MGGWNLAGGSEKDERFPIENMLEVGAVHCREVTGHPRRKQRVGGVHYWKKKKKKKMDVKDNITTIQS